MLCSRERGEANGPAPDDLSSRQNVGFPPITGIRGSDLSSDMATDVREVEGVLERHHTWLFVETDAGHRWRLDVDERRIIGLLGLRVRATGILSSGTIRVDRVHRA
jgi:hypothetical protein